MHTEDTIPSRPRISFALLAGIVFLLAGLLAYDLYPVMVLRSRIDSARALAADGTPLGEFRRRMEARGMQVENIDNMNALLIVYLPRTPVLVRATRKLNEWLAPLSIKLPTPGGSSTIVFLNNALDDASTTIPANRL